MAVSFGSQGVDGAVRAVIKRRLERLRRENPRPTGEARNLADALEEMRTRGDGRGLDLINWARSK